MTALQGYCVRTMTSRVSSLDSGLDAWSVLPPWILISWSLTFQTVFGVFVPLWATMLTGAGVWLVYLADHYAAPPEDAVNAPGRAIWLTGLKKWIPAIMAVAVALLSWIMLRVWMRYWFAELILPGAVLAVVGSSAPVHRWPNLRLLWVAGMWALATWLPWVPWTSSPSLPIAWLGIMGALFGANVLLCDYADANGDHQVGRSDRLPHPAWPVALGLLAAVSMILLWLEGPRPAVLPTLLGGAGMLVLGYHQFNRPLHGFHQKFRADVTLALGSALVFGLSLALSMADRT